MLSDRSCQQFSFFERLLSVTDTKRTITDIHRTVPSLEVEEFGLLMYLA